MQKVSKKSDTLNAWNDMRREMNAGMSVEPSFDLYVTPKRWFRFFMDGTVYLFEDYWREGVRQDTNPFDIIWEHRKAWNALVSREEA